MDEKTAKNAKNNERKPVIIKISMKVVVIIAGDNNSSTVVYGVIF